jgi:hypothetical protein
LPGSISAFVHISDGKMNGVNVLDLLVLEPGAFDLMDRGYLDFAHLFQMHQAGAFFMTLAKKQHERQARLLGQGGQDRRHHWRSDPSR